MQNLVVFFVFCSVCMSHSAKLLHAEYRNLSRSQFTVAMDYLEPQPEVKVYMTKDGIAVIYPSPILERKDFVRLERSTPIRDIDFEKLKELNYSDSKLTFETDNTIMALDEFLDFVRERELGNLPLMKIVIDLKVETSNQATLIRNMEEVAYVLKRGWVVTEVFVKSDSADAVAVLKTHNELLRNIRILDSSRSSGLSCLPFYSQR